MFQVKSDMKKSNFYRSVLTSALALATCAAVPVAAQSRVPAAQPMGMPIAPITVPTVNAVPAPNLRIDAADSICLVEPSLEVNVGFPVDGVLESVHADRGDVVAPGQVLARMSAGVELAAVELQTTKAEFGARKRSRNEDLQRKSLISQQELDELTTEQKVSELELRERQEQLKLRAVLSPIHGVVVDRFRNRGDIVKQEKIFRLVQLDPLFIETVVPAARFGKIGIGQAYSVGLQLGGRPTARVVSVDRVIDAASGTFRVRLAIPNPNNQIPPGQRCRVSFVSTQ